MGGSSDSGKGISDNISEGVGTSAAPERNLRFLHSSRRSLSTDTSRDFVFGIEGSFRDQDGPASDDHLRNHVVSSSTLQDETSPDQYFCGVEWGDVSLRQWLDNPMRSVDTIECLHIFSQIVEIVSVAHSQGIAVNNVKPSCFVMSSLNRVSFIESASCSDSGSDSPEEGLNNPSGEVKDISCTTGQGTIHTNSQLDNSVDTVSQLISGTSFLKSSSVPGPAPSAEDREGCGTRDGENTEHVEERKQSFPMKKLLMVETSWYTSPEEIAGASSSCASDIYRLGILLFELFCTFSSLEEKGCMMSSLRHRVLPPHLLLKWPKEASFCLWLLHPDPSTRPKMGELLQSEFLHEPRDDIEERQAAIDLRDKMEEDELLLEFLRLMRQTKLEAANKLHDVISLLSSDIEEILNKQRFLRRKAGSSEQEPEIYFSQLNLPQMDTVENEEETSSGARKRVRQRRSLHNSPELDSHTEESLASEMSTDSKENLVSKHSRLMRNFKKLESAYLLMRSRTVKPPGKLQAGQSPMSCNSKDSAVLNERSSVINSSSKGANVQGGESGWVSPFLEGLCKYLSFSKLRVKANLKQGDLLSSSNLVCSVSFDRDGEFFAAAGVNKKIKVFECDAILNEDRDIHYPAVEMASRSKLSSVSWNGYIKSQIASSNFEGVVQVWDVTRSQVFTEFREHERRVWSVDFSLADPTILASGSDDGSVKLWSINQGASIGTIKTKANVCCVQFPTDTGRCLAFGSADHRVYYYDLRNPRVPLCTMIGHNKTVSYVKFVDSMNLVSASTDNTIKLWDLAGCTSRVLESPYQSFGGHTNVKNFVGLSVSDGYIATGSETNEVYVYHKAFPMPALSYKFESKDPHSGHDFDDTSQFISSVCWRGHSSMLVGANSTGDIKILEMV